jgi:hypothetical protein
MRSHAAGALALCAESTAALPQSPADFFNFFGGVLNAAVVDNARREWLTRPPFEYACLNSRGLSAERLALQGIPPFDPRVRRLMVECASTQRAASVPPVSPQIQPSQSTYNPRFIVDGIVLGSVLQSESEADGSYACKASDQFPGFTWCRRTRTETSIYAHRRVAPSTFRNRFHPLCSRQPA